MDVFANAGPIVGREAELGALESALSALADGQAACLSFEGEPGIGKTRLLRELRERAERDGHLVLAGTGAEFERDLPYGLWVDALDDYVASQDLDLADDVAHELARVLPSLSSGESAGAAVADERYRVHRAMRSLLAALSDDQALLLVLDDLHWADDASVELLGALLRRGLGGSVLIAIGFRSGQAPERLSAALASQPATRHVLAPLDEAQAAQLLAGVEPEAVAAIVSRGGGVPFYLEQLARGGAGTPTPTNGEVVELGGVPAAVVAVLSEELNALEPAARQLLDAAAVAGEPFELDLAAAMAGAAPADALDALDDLLTADLVRPTAVPRRFGFRHPIVRQAVYESLRAGRRLAAHARAAEELAARGASASERAAHVEHAAAQGDEAAIAVLLEAGDETLGRAPAAAVRWYEAALRLLPGADREQQVEVLVKLASSLRAAGELERCRTTLLDALARLPLQADARRIELTTQCAAVEHWQGRHAEAHRRLAGAFEDLADRDTPQAAALQIELAVDSLYEMDHPQAVAMARDALSTARRLDDRGLVMAAAAALALAAAVQGDTPLAQEHRELAVAGARAAARRRARPPAGCALPPRLGRELSRALRRRGRARRARPRAGARHRTGSAAGAAAARQGLSDGDAGPARRGAGRGADRGRDRAPVSEPALPLLGTVRGRVGALLRGRPCWGDRGLRGEPARRRGQAHARHDAVSRRRARAGRTPRRSSRREIPPARSRWSSSSGTTSSPGRSPSSAASTGSRLPSRSSRSAARTMPSATPPWRRRRPPDSG